MVALSFGLKSIALKIGDKITTRPHDDMTKRLRDHQTKRAPVVLGRGRSCSRFHPAWLPDTIELCQSSPLTAR